MYWNIDSKNALYPAISSRIQPYPAISSYIQLWLDTLDTAGYGWIQLDMGRYEALEDIFSVTDTVVSR